MLSHRHREHLRVLRRALLLLEPKLDPSQRFVLGPIPFLRPRSAHHLGVLEEEADDLVDAFEALVGETDRRGEEAADGVIREPSAAHARGDPVGESLELQGGQQGPGTFVADEFLDVLDRLFPVPPLDTRGDREDEVELLTLPHLRRVDHERQLPGVR